MSKIQPSKRDSLVVRTTIISSKGDAVKVTKLELSKEGIEMLRSQSSGIRSKRDSNTEPQDSRFEAVPA